MYELQINRVSILKVVDPNILKIIFFSRLKALIDAKVFCPSFLKIWMFDLFFFFFFSKEMPSNKGCRTQECAETGAADMHLLCTCMPIVAVWYRFF